MRLGTTREVGYAFHVLPLFFALLVTEPAPAAADSSVARDLVSEVNLARTDPRAYAAKLRAHRRLYVGHVLRQPGQIDIVTQEGVAAVDEAIAHLERQRPVPALDHDEALAAAALDHVSDQGPKGALGHASSDGRNFTHRFTRRGAAPYGGENIAYGSPQSAEAVVLQLLVDDGVRDRGHRKNIFQTGYRRIGAACGTHATYRYMCVTDFGY